MSGETDLAILLRTLAPKLDAKRYVMAHAVSAVSPNISPIATFREDEGLSVIVDADEWAATGLPASAPLARLTMMVHSSLEAVGMTAAIAAALTEAGISANVVAAYHHDHIFVPWDRRHDALAAIEALTKSANPASA